MRPVTVCLQDGSEDPEDVAAEVCDGRGSHATGYVASRTAAPQEVFHQVLPAELPVAHQEAVGTRQEGGALGVAGGVVGGAHV